MTTTTIYVLSLEGGRYYIGKTDNLINRYQQHQKGVGSAWTKQYKPMALVKTIENASPFDEDKITKEYMSIYGIDKVRGGTYISLDLTEEQEDLLRREIRGAKDKCMKCGKSGHFANQCKRKSSFEGSCGCGKKFLDFEEYITHFRMCMQRRNQESESDDDDENEWACDYCERTFTTKFGCIVHERSCKQENTKKKPIKKADSMQGSGTCYRCGREGHYASSCYASKHIKGYYIRN